LDYDTAKGEKAMTGKKNDRGTRQERDFLGSVRVPAGAYYGIQTVRAARNFPISGLRPHPEMIRASVLIKKAAALANSELGRLEKRKAAAIVRACDEISGGKFGDQFIVDVFQMGAGTSFHMNVNEVIANRAGELIGGKRGEYRYVHPNDHVNMGQSTNDVYPTAMRLAAALLLRDHLRPRLRNLEAGLRDKAGEFDRVVKAGRTHLQDAAPVRMGREFGAYSRAVGRCGQFLTRRACPCLSLGSEAAPWGPGSTRRPATARR
jgi:aspartate ammonia-lyase